MSDRKEWMLGIPGHNELVTLDQVLLLVRGGSLRPTDLVKKLGEPWRAANEVNELAAHFTDAPAPPRRQMDPIPLKASETARLPEPTARQTAKPPESTRSIPKVDVRPAPPKAAEDRSPIRTTTARVASVAAPPKEDKKAETKPPPAPEPPPPAKAPEIKPAAKAPPPAASPAKEDKKAETKHDKTDKISARSLRNRPLPKAPQAPAYQIEPMVGKYYSPVDMLRSASFAFEPKKLLYCFPVVLLMILWSVGDFISDRSGGAYESVLFVLFTAVLVFGLAFILTGLAFVTRRQLEGRDYYLGEVVHYTVKSSVTALVYPVLALVPSLLSLGILFLLRLARNRSPGMASTLKFAFVVPMIFAFIAVLGALVYQVASMFVPAAGAIEGEGLGPTVRHAWNHVRRQWGRVVLHWLIVTVAFGVITAVCLGLSELAIRLPEWVFGPAEDGLILEKWSQFAGLHAGYRGLAYGLGMMLPVSLFSTLGTLSYLSLRHPAGAQLSPTPLDDTSGIALGAMRGGHGPGDSTNPSETRPAPVDPASPLSDISDDSDEQPLVKD
jgi:hypothetical protein